MVLNPLPFALTLGGITFRLTVIWSGPFVQVRRNLKIGQRIRADVADFNRSKEGTPTMGGLLILVPVFLITLALNLVNLIRPPTSGRVTGVSILLPLYIMVGYGLLGGIDDYMKLSSKGEGISPKAKLFGQIVLAAIAAVVMSLVNGGVQYANEISIPILGVLPLS